MLLEVLLVLSLFAAHPSQVGSQTSYTWRLDADMGKVMPASSFPQPPPSPHGRRHGGEPVDEKLLLQEAVLDILMSTITSSDGTWRKTSHEKACFHCEKPNVGVARNNRGVPIDGYDSDNHASETDLDDEVLECGKPVNFTYYDHLVGIQNRHTHAQMPEPEVVSLFKVKKTGRKNANGESTVEIIERRLKKSKRDKPKSLELYNQIGNFWRIKGDTRKSIECFRRALAVSPNNADILLNLARVLFNLQYLDDAIFLTRRSLEVQPPDQNAWHQHFQLGEILKAYSHYQEAALHLRHVLELKPNYEPAILALEEMEAIPNSSVHPYTIFIILFLGFAVSMWIKTTLYASQGPEENGHVPNGRGRLKMFQRQRR
ncbi:hypothetical protein TCAL_01341 [Tigriopus californicus]|uniref:Uncharacterized protein n=1 Tax=Tigriopus californicus TaxID=6832 RepID=A0A553PA35_TIGCA|nr:uncharacterized protein LOC131892936 [Tigriopus californicus]TRY74547.1 hypothetical protein TCAL_01341 [Tigriopus californicus]|eukprot:TCALIF_01341-PA protein Name:"Similar to TTC17 Tetratricopeptide repeat protein 17 (Homo sapiens)" AED:0.04 eAED:0.04 QI:0/-1/0/1/-1/1/1/0/372